RHCAHKNRPPDLAQEVWHQIESFAGYSFAKGHSASFAVESYQSMYLKAHFPLEFLTAVINNFGGFYSTEFYLHEAKRYGAKVEAPCVNESWSLTRLQGTTIWLGFGLIQGLEEKSLIRIMEARKQGAFVGLADFLSRTDLSVEQTSLLVRVGAFRFSELPKQTLLWQVHSSARKTSKKPSVATDYAGLFHPEEPNTDGLPPWECSPHSDAWDELELLGFTLEAPFPLLQTAPVGKAADLRKNVGRSFRIVGQLVTIKPTRTVKGQRMFFGTFLDQNGDWIDTVHFPPVAAKFPFRGQGCYLLEGRVTQEFNFPTLEVFRMEKCAWK
ncbi:MAG: DNA polymerase III subunit alpha, partial [Bacteroidia bacterium]